MWFLRHAPEHFLPEQSLAEHPAEHFLPEQSLAEHPAEHFLPEQSLAEHPAGHFLPEQSLAEHRAGLVQIVRCISKDSSRHQPRFQNQDAEQDASGKRQSQPQPCER